MTIDDFLNQFILYVVIAAFGLAVVIVLVSIRRDRNFAMAMMFGDAMLVIVMATWGKSIALDAFLKVSSFEMTVRAGNAPSDIFLGVLGVTVTGIFAIIMMLIRHNYEVRKLPK